MAAESVIGKSLAWVVLMPWTGKRFMASRAFPSPLRWRNRYSETWRWTIAHAIADQIEDVLRPAGGHGLGHGFGKKGQSGNGEAVAQKRAAAVHGHVLCGGR